MRGEEARGERKKERREREREEREINCDIHRERPEPLFPFVSCMIPIVFSPGVSRFKFMFVPAAA